MKRDIRAPSHCGACELRTLVQGLVASVVLFFVIDCFVITDDFESGSIKLLKYGCFKAYSAEILRSGDN